MKLIDQLTQWTILVAVVLALAMIDTMNDRMSMLVELAEQDMIEYCINIQPTEYDMEMINDNN